MNEKKKLLFKKIIFLSGFLIFVLLVSSLTVFLLLEAKELKSAESFKEFILSYGAKGTLVGFGLQILQVFAAFIPGEVIEIGLGFAYGAIKGTLICYAGLAFASALVFLLVKKGGIKLVELFFSMEKINSLRFVKNVINDKEKLKRLAFILFLVPGTPKDLFTYFFGLTPLTLGEFLVISLIGRLPSVLSSTIGGMFIHDGKIAEAVILFAFTALLSILGWLFYENHKKKK